MPSIPLTCWPNVDFTPEASYRYWKLNSVPILAVSYDTNNLRRYWRAASLFIGFSAVDIGCGEAVLGELLRMVRNVGGMDPTYMGIDFVGNKATLIHDCTSPLPFEADLFDTGYALDFLEHIHDPERVLRELARVTKHRIVISTPQHDKIPKANHLWNFTLDEIESLMKSVGELGGIEEIANINWIAWSNKQPSDCPSKRVR